MKNDTALLGSILMEESRHVVITTLGSRLYRNRSELTHQPHAWCPGNAKGWAELKGKRVSLVIGGNRAERELLRFGENFAGLGLEVHLQRPGSDNWQTVQPAASGD
jgi:hypothetical protein